jgi:hypothetical protein
MDFAAKYKDKAIKALLTVKGNAKSGATAIVTAFVNQ